MCWQSVRCLRKCLKWGVRVLHVHVQPSSHPVESQTRKHAVNNASPSIKPVGPQRRVTTIRLKHPRMMAMSRFCHEVKNTLAVCDAEGWESLTFSKRNAKNRTVASVHMTNSKCSNRTQNFSLGPMWTCIYISAFCDFHTSGGHGAMFPAWIHPASGQFRPDLSTNSR